MLKKNKKAICFLLLVCSLIVLSGCWDRRDVERNAFILGIGIDAAEDEKMEVTFEVALPQSFLGGGEGGGSSGDTEATFDVSVVAENMVHATNALLGKIDLFPEFSHLQLIVLGEEFAKKGVHTVMDYFFRSSRIRYRTDVVVSKGEAKKIFEFKPKTDKAVSMYINQILQYNSEENSGIFRLQDIGTIYSNFIRHSPIFLSKVSLEKDILDLTGGGVFKDEKLVGWYGGKEVEAIRWLQGDSMNGGVLRIEMPKSKGGNVGLSIFNSNVSLIPVLFDNQITAEAKIYVEGDIISVGVHDVNEKVDKLVLEWEEAFEKYIYKNVVDTFKKGRDVFEADTFEIDGRMADYYPEYWEVNKDNWDEIFKTIELKLDVDVKIRRVGNAQP